MSGRRNLESLAHGIERCRKCPLAEHRQHAVPGEGPQEAAVMLVGEAPGAKEDETGRPFAGMAGTVLDQILEAAGWRRDELFVTSSVKCRPPDNRTPHAGELATCREAWLDPQIEALSPRVVVLLGRVAVRCVLGIDDPLAGVHGQAIERDGRRYVITYHPAGAMRGAERRRRMIADLRGVHGLLAARD